MKLVFSLVLVAGMAISLGCSKSEKSADKTAAPATYTVRALVKSKTADTVVLHHEAIPDFVSATGEKSPMMSMSMPFALDDAAMAASVEVGDKVTATVEVDWTKKPALRAKAFEKLPAETELTLVGH